MVGAVLRRSQKGSYFLEKSSCAYSMVVLMRAEKGIWDKHASESVILGHSVLSEHGEQLI